MNDHAPTPDAVPPVDGASADTPAPTSWTSEAPEAERLRAALATIERLRRERVASLAAAPTPEASAASVPDPAPSNASPSPATASLAVAALVAGPVADAAPTRGPAPARGPVPRSPVPRALRQHERPAGRWKATMLATLALAVGGATGFVAGQGGPKEAPVDEALTRRIAELEAETTELQAELLRLEAETTELQAELLRMELGGLPADESAAARPPDARPRAASTTPVATSALPEPEPAAVPPVASPPPDERSGALGGRVDEMELPPEESAEQRSYGAIAAPPE